MARIAGVDLPRDKRLEIALTAIYGVGRTRAREIAEMTKIDPGTKVGDLADVEITRIREVLEKNFSIEGDLRAGNQKTMRRLMEIGSYRGQRHKRLLPSRGQRTHTNARTRKGPRRRVGTRKG